MPTPNTITVAGEEVEILPPTLRQLSEILPRIVPIINAAAKTADSNRNWVMALHDNALDLGTAVALATGRDSEWIFGLGFDDFLKLLQATFEAYSDYLRKSALPNLRIVHPKAED